MGRLPTIRSNISAASGRTTGVVNGPRATADTMAPAAGALAAFGQGVTDLSAGLQAIDDEQAKASAANAVAQADFTREELEMRQKAPANGSGHQDAVLSRYDEWVQEQAVNIEDTAARKAFVSRMDQQRPSVSSRAAVYEFKIGDDNAREETNRSLTSLDNRVRGDATQYDDLLQSGMDVIDTQTFIPAHQREGMKTTYRENLALSRFEGLLSSAKTVEDVAVIEEQLADEDWQGQLSGAGYERVLGLASGAKTSIATQADANARAAIDTIEARAKDLQPISHEELARVQGVVNSSQNPVTQARMARIVRDQMILQQAKLLTASQQRDAAQANRPQGTLPARVDTAISRAAGATGVTAAYLAQTVNREFGQQLKGDDPDYGAGNAAGASTGVGVMQWLQGSFREEVARPTVTKALQEAFGIDVASLSNAQIDALRADPDVAIFVGAHFAKRNGAAVRAVTGRQATPEELYMGHFLGNAGVTRLLSTLKVSRDASAVALFPEAAKSNPTEFRRKDGSARTVAELHSELGRMHGGGEQTAMQYADAETRERIADQTESAVNSDPMSHSDRMGIISMSDIFEPGGMTARGEQAGMVADYYDIPVNEMKPFTEDEVGRIQSYISRANADEVVDFMMGMQDMGPMTDAGLSQIGEDSNVFAYAGGLASATGRRGVASDIIKGQKRLDENTSILAQIGATRADIDNEFVSVTGRALDGVAPAQRQSVQDAAMAHYVETAFSRGSIGSFDTEAYAASVDAVMGGEAIGEINGVKVALPVGVSAVEFESAFENMTESDWLEHSVTGDAPAYGTGEIADASDLVYDATLRAIGGNQYTVMVEDGTFLTTGRADGGGRMELYTVRIDADVVKQVNKKHAATIEAARAADAAQDEELRDEVRTRPGVVPPHIQRLLDEATGAPPDDGATARGEGAADAQSRGETR